MFTPQGQVDLHIVDDEVSGIGPSRYPKPSQSLGGFRSAQSISAGSKLLTPSFPSQQSAPSKIKLDHFSSALKPVLKNVYSFLRVQLATTDAFPMDRAKFIGDYLQAYSQLPSTSPDFKEHILMAEEKQKEMYTAYVSFKVGSQSCLTHKKLAVESSSSDERRGQNCGI